MENEEKVLQFPNGVKAFGEIDSESNNLLRAATYNITWQGQSSPSSAASISYSSFNSSKSLYVSAVVKGSPVGGNQVNAKVTVTPTNYKLRSGKSNVSVNVFDSDLGNYLVLDVTPTSAYNGKTVTATVSISSSVSGNVVTATGQISQ